MHAHELNNPLSPVLESARLFLESDDVNFITGNLLLAVMGKFLVTKAMILLWDEQQQNHIVFSIKGRCKYSVNEKLPLSVKKNEEGRFPVVVDLKEGQAPEGFSTLFNLRSASKHLGFLCLGPRFNDQPLTLADRDFVLALAGLAAISISNAQLILSLKNSNRNLDRKIYELNTLFDLSKQFNELEGREAIADMLKFTLMGHLFVRRIFFAYRTHQADRNPLCIAHNSLDYIPNESDLNALFDAYSTSTIVAAKDMPASHTIHQNHIDRVFYLHFQNELLGVIALGTKANGKPISKEEEQFILSMSNLALLSVQKVSLLQQKVEKERMEDELNLAKSIQKGLLPDALPSWEKFELFGMNRSSRQVGGDYYDFRKGQDGSWYLAIADVTGKGIPASLLMSNLQAALQTLLQATTDLSEASSRLNDTIYNNTPSDKFITFFWGRFDPETGVFEYVNAGHNPPMLYKAQDQSITELQEGGLLLGAMPSMMPYEQGRCVLSKGDVLLMFTDGVTESFNAQEEEYGEERLAHFIAQNADKSAKLLSEALVQEIMDFSDGIQFDDLTMLVLKAK